MTTRSRPENEKPGNEKLNSRFTLKIPLLQIESVQERKFVAIFVCGLILLFTLTVILSLLVEHSSQDQIEIAFQNRTIRKIKSGMYFYLRKKVSHMKLS